MILIKSVPLVDYQKSIFKLLKENQTIPVYGKTPLKAELPCITFGSILAKPTDTKTSVMWEVTIEINVWGDKNGKAEVNSIINDITTVLSANEILVDKYETINTEIDSVQVYETTDNGYFGTLSLSTLLQQISLV
jgi:hypothetical protein